MYVLLSNITFIDVKQLCFFIHCIYHKTEEAHL